MNSTKAKRRKRALALPFVVTAASATALGCHPGANQPASNQPVHANPPSHGQHPHANPPPPTSQEEQTPPVHRVPVPPQGPTAPDPRTTNPPPPQLPRPKLPSPSGETTNNPPPIITKPKPVPTKPTTPSGRIVVNKDGTCWWHANVTCVKGATCNPPPPRKVDCQK